jgi:tRNA A-37 threonylcarbamoyl transferase component Bud32
LWKNRKEILGAYIDSVQHPLRDKALRGAYHLTNRIFRVTKFSFQDVARVATEISAKIMHPSRERVLRNLLKLFESNGMLIRDGSTYGLSENILKHVKNIPDWLEDGYVDAKQLLDEVKRLDEIDATSALDLTPRPKHLLASTGTFDIDDFASVLEGLPEYSHEETVFRRDDSQEHESQFDRDSLVGHVIGGRYCVEKILGSGGISAVYLANDAKLVNRRVVIKVLRDRSLRDEWVGRKFMQEREALARVDHPGIVGVLDAGQLPNRSPYIVMQYIEGTTLRHLLTSSGMDFARTANIIGQLTNALEDAHNHGIIHRDLKPENIMIQLEEGETERVRIIDFGIAKVEQSLIATSTVTGLTAGTVMYMSPEQLRGESVTPASDIYALGIVSYEMVTGRRPFNPETIFQLSEMQQKGVRVSPRDLRPALPEQAQDAIMRALSYNISERHQKAAAFGDDLVKALS